MVNVITVKHKHPLVNDKLMGDLPSIYHNYYIDSITEFFDNIPATRDHLFEKIWNEDEQEEIEIPSDLFINLLCVDYYRMTCSSYNKKKQYTLQLVLRTKIQILILKCTWTKSGKKIYTADIIHHLRDDNHNYSHQINYHNIYAQNSNTGNKYD